MSQSISNQLLHCVFSTKNRQKLITAELAARLYPYFGGIARSHKIKLLAAGGMPDHVHLLISLPATLSLSKAMQLLKGNSSKWIHETFPEHRSFEWQRGYGAFSVEVSGIKRTANYISNQVAHHKARTFEQEYVTFLEKNGMDYDPRYIFD